MTAQHSEQDKAKCTILIVEGDATHGKKIKKILQIYGYTDTVEVADGMSAWARLKQLDVKFVICDLHLDQMNGLALLKIMMADSTFCTIPFLMMSSTADQRDVIDAAKAGVSGFIVKPFHHEKFMGKIKQILEKDVDPVQKKVQDLFELGKKNIEEGNFEKALEIYNKILELNDEAEAYYQIGYIKQAQGDMEEAAKAFRKATQVNTTFVKAYESLGLVYKKIGKPEESEKHYEKAGDLYLKKEMLEQAEGVFQEAHRLNPKNINIFNSLGIIYRRKRLYDKAILEYKKALKVSPDDENIHFNIARACLEAKKIPMAQKHLEQSLAINPNFKEAVSLLKAIGLGFSN